MWWDYFLKDWAKRSFQDDNIDFVSSSMSHKDNSIQDKYTLWADQVFCQRDWEAVATLAILPEKCIVFGLQVNRDPSDLWHLDKIYRLLYMELPAKERYWSLGSTKRKFSLIDYIWVLLKDSIQVEINPTNARLGQRGKLIIYWNRCKQILWVLIATITMTNATWKLSCMSWQYYYLCISFLIAMQML